MTIDESYTQAIYESAQKMDGQQYWSEACAKSVTDCLVNAHCMNLLPSTKGGNNNWVPNWDPAWTGHGNKVLLMATLQPGDLVVYNWTPNEIPSPPQSVGPESGYGYDHIGVYAGKGYVYNVSSMNDHKFVPTLLNESNFQFGVHFPGPT